MLIPWHCMIKIIGDLWFYIDVETSRFTGRFLYMHAELVLHPFDKSLYEVPYVDYNSANIYVIFYRTIVPTCPRSSKPQ